MVDRENVIEALERCINGNHDGCQYKYGGAATFEHCRSDLMRDALALLKEQEPVKPILAHIGNYAAINDYTCPVCKSDLYHLQKYCDECGRAVKWDED